MTLDLAANVLLIIVLLICLTLDICRLRRGA